jgi:two-component system nitrogen regulation sensor histidine kinase NtrY
VGNGNQRLVVGAVLPSHLLIHLQRTTDADVQFQELKAQQGTVTATTILVFLSVTLLLLFSTVWIGLYLSRRFTAPLLAVVDATRRVAEGDALEEVVAPASDEVEVLVDSFNAMVRRVRATEQEILSSNHELATLLATIPTGVLTLSPDDASFRPNAAAAGMLGHHQWQRTWQPIENLETPGLEELWRYIDGGDPLRQRTEIDLTVGGETRHVEVSRRPLAGGGSVVAIDDLTELVAAQRQAAWSEVARRIAHEIKNPLTPIQLAAERVQRRVSTLGLEGDIEQILTSSCEAIVAHVSGLQDLVDSFHQYAQMPAVTLRPWWINRLVDETVALYEDFRQGVKITTRCLQETLWAMVDPVLLRQALVNLIDNAAAAIPGSGTIEVRVEREGDRAILEILDSGTGLPTDDVQVLTQPFFSTKGRGSGMGLAIVDRIVRDHGGVFEIGGRGEGGTRARIVLIGAVVPQPTEEQSRELSFSATSDTI